MQRFLSLATLAVLGGLGYLFLKGGGLEQIVVTGRPSQQSSAPAPSDRYQTPGPWMGQPTTPAISSPGNRPILPPPEQANDRAIDPTIRIASFNIEVFGNKKASKPHVMYTLADIIRLFDVVAIQEIRSQNEYLIPNFVRLINQEGRKYDHVIGPRVGFTTSKEQYAFIYDSERIEVDHQSVYTISDPDGLLHRPPLVATFRTVGVDPDLAFTFTLVDTHTDPGAVQGELSALAEVYRVVRRSSRGEDDIILLGDFNADDRHLGRLQQLPGIRPLIAGVFTNTRQTAQYDNLIIHQPSTTEYSGRSGVLDISRRYKLSPQQAEEVSDHYPVWAEFSIYERDYAGRIASRRRPAGR